MKYLSYLKTAISKLMSNIPPNIKKMHIPMIVSSSEEVGTFGVLYRVDFLETVKIDTRGYH